MYINYGENEVPVKTEVVEKKYNAKYIGNFALKMRNGWTESPAQLYWQEKPPIEGYSNYFGIFVNGGQVFITSGQSVADEIITGVIDGDEIIFSRYRHDYRVTKENKLMIDGGRDYTKTNTNKTVKLKLVGPELVVIDNVHDINISI